MERARFYYDLPQELIAQHPAVPRDASRLMCLDKTTGEITGRMFRGIADMLRPDDLLVVNDSKVLPARLLGSKDSGASVEILLLRDLGDDVWDCIVKPGKRLRAGARAVFGGGLLNARIEDETADGNRNVRFSYDKSRSFFDILDEIGTMPLPHYITEPINDASEYQTVYAEHLGSAAAPTAGLHFTNALLEQITANGTGVARVTLHVGLGTFRPVKENDITQHIMHREWYTVPEKTADMVRKTKEAGGRVIAVGTTSCRTLEAVSRDNGAVIACSGSTDIFIYPGYEFKVIDALITNFHLPESTLIMLVCAFAGYDKIMNAYRRAVEERYRFFSFGDAMFIY